MSLTTTETQVSKSISKEAIIAMTMASVAVAVSIASPLIIQNKMGRYDKMIDKMNKRLDDFDKRVSDLEYHLAGSIKNMSVSRKSDLANYSSQIRSLTNELAELKSSKIQHQHKYDLEVEQDKNEFQPLDMAQQIDNMS